MTKRTKRILALAFLPFVAFSISCEKDYYVEPDISLPDTVYYSVDIQPFWDGSCVNNCHNGGGIPLDLSSGGSYDAIVSGNYVNLSAPTESKLYTKLVKGGSMEQYSTPANTAMVLKWIEQGALNN